MCIIIAKDVGSTVLNDHLLNAAKNNPHGCGYMYPAEDKKSIIIRRFMNSESLFDSYEKVIRERRGEADTPVVLHFRVATHGSIKLSNCHPFEVNKEISMAHNGTIRGLTLPEDKTDSETFALQYLSFLRGHQIRDTRLLNLVTKAVGENRIVLMNIQGQISIVNKARGTEDDEGCWFSNLSYLPDPTKPRRNRGKHSGDGSVTYGKATSVKWNNNELVVVREGANSSEWDLPWGTMFECCNCGVSSKLPSKDPGVGTMLLCSTCEAYIRCPECLVVLNQVDLAFNTCSMCKCILDD